MVIAIKKKKKQQGTILVRETLKGVEKEKTSPKRGHVC